jgi:hypothetical protein
MDKVEHGLDRSDAYAIGTLFVGQSMAHKFNCQPEVDDLLGALIEIETPQLPSEDPVEVLAPVDALLNWVEREPALFELVRALFELGAQAPPRTEKAQRLYRAVLWVMMRHDPTATTPEVLAMVGEATPGARFQSKIWPSHEFFACVLVLVYLGGERARAELQELVAAARELDYHALVPVLEWYLDHNHSAPSR